MIVDIDTLEVGDEILLAIQADFRRLRITRPIKKNPKKTWGSYSVVMCDILNVHDLNDNTVKRTMYQDLNFRQIWMLKQANKNGN